MVSLSRVALVYMALQSFAFLVLVALKPMVFVSLWTGRTDDIQWLTGLSGHYITSHWNKKLLQVTFFCLAFATQSSPRLASVGSLAVGVTALVMTPLEAIWQTRGAALGFKYPFPGILATLIPAFLGLLGWFKSNSRAGSPHVEEAPVPFSVKLLLSPIILFGLVFPTLVIVYPEYMVPEVMKATAEYLEPHALAVLSSYEELTTMLTWFSFVTLLVDGSRFSYTVAILSSLIALGSSFLELSSANPIIVKAMTPAVWAQLTNMVLVFMVLVFLAALHQSRKARRRDRNESRLETLHCDCTLSFRVTSCAVATRASTGNTRWHGTGSREKRGTRR